MIRAAHLRSAYFRTLSCNGRLFHGMSQACFIRHISVTWNGIQTADNEANYLIIYCLNCIQRKYSCK